MEGKYGYINKEGKVIIAFKYEYASSFKNGLAWVSSHYVNGYGYVRAWIDKQGNYVYKEHKFVTTEN
ncbi:WG repeat-containing protein [Fulvivirga ulvae]|uniref:WG repeat-containing protein n=1 Tax=Fulvivirga ulvae TaxID=2904245 RepID=UPI001F26DE7F|nr:WG repeat-containing protein [Fulvivirga ulvae]UII29968.1 WG repeat-containing protein [Fulvivirga ulvae]